MSGKKKSLPKLPSMSSEVVKTLTEEPNNRPKIKKETEKKMKTLYISVEADRLLRTLYAEGEGKQNEIFEKAIRLYWSLREVLPEEGFRRLVKLAEKEEIEKIKRRLEFK
ncbi:hypothetical protein [Thermococcus sibiricus]|uniref:CopG family transcriptional regulator n=2 Tax=Thermococcus TaxID=2263 RepID=C6A2G1_THESM|nr:hypothetical protein [Thermococcus sibiricus]ACS89806.1 hypothetical protein TSIB_0745 [Thermococcus sibiricus MM 739]